MGVVFALWQLFKGNSLVLKTHFYATHHYKIIPKKVFCWDIGKCVTVYECHRVWSILHGMSLVIMEQATQRDEASQPVKIACFKSIPNLLKTVIFKYSPKLPPKRPLTLKIDKTDHKAVIYFEVNRWEDKVKRTTLPNLDSCQKFKKRFSCSVKSYPTFEKTTREKKLLKLWPIFYFLIFTSVFYFKGVQSCFYAHLYACTWQDNKP